MQLRGQDGQRKRQRHCAFFCNDTATTEIYTLSLHDALPIYNGHTLLTEYPECARRLDKYRINPGNVGVGEKHDDNFRRMIEVAVANGKPVRIGVNWGSLDRALLTSLMDANHKRPEPLTDR